MKKSKKARNQTVAVINPMGGKSLAELMAVIKRPGFTPEERKAAAREVWARRSPAERSAVAAKAAMSRAKRRSLTPLTSPVADKGALIALLTELVKRI